MSETTEAADASGPKLLTAEWKAKLKAMTIPGDNRASLQRLHDEAARRRTPLDPDLRAKLEEMGADQLRRS
ncbi:MAG: hypothetical protein S0880_31155 [Actinomycetota bacterium]|nr:hypothetical protein [Actinomycetota bacterium]